MDNQVTSHPSDNSLLAFDLGKLDEDRAETVSAHLEHCAQCRKQVESQYGDDFLARLRLAHGPGTTPAPGKPMEETLIDPRLPQPESASPIAELPPELINHPQYEILRELGRGGMGVVYLAKNRLMKRHEVLKVVNQHVLQHAGGKERFLREIQSAARLHHPNVVTAYSVLPLGDLLALAMEYIPGEDLAKVVAARGPLPVAPACDYIRQAALGLQHAFEKRMVHRDIKPQNLILYHEGEKKQIKILDFGLAKVMHEETKSGLTSTGQAMGTPEFMAPEQCLDAASADIRADIYSLGCTLYFLLTGTVPFPGKSMYEILHAQQTREAKPVNRGRPDIPLKLVGIVRKMMAKRISDRYQTPLDVALALEPFVDSRGEGPGESVAPARPGTRRRRVGRTGAELSTVVPKKDTRVSPGGTKRSAGSQQTQPGFWSRQNRRRIVIASAALVIVLLATAIVRIVTNKGEIVVEVDAPGVEITVKENGATIQDRPGQREIALSAGEHALRIELKDRNGDTSFVTRNLTVKRGSKEIIHVQYQLANAKPDESKVDQPPSYKPEQPIANAPLPAAKVIAADPSLTFDLRDGLKMEFVRIPAGEFMMGKPDSEPPAREDEKSTAPRGWRTQEERKERPSHRVAISKDFYMAKYPVTQEQYSKLMGRNPSYFSATGGGKAKVEGMDTDRFPVETVSWQEAQEFCRKLSELTGRPCTLPTEAQWEYACRGGTTTPFYFGTSCNGTQVNCRGSYPFGTAEKGPYLERTCPVGSYPANPFGLYDMCGNVCQWCQDYCDAQPYDLSVSVDPQGPAYGPMRVERGGGWDHECWGCRSAYRAGNGAANRYNNTGFRVVFAPGGNGASLRQSPAPDMPTPASLDTGAPAEAKRSHDRLELGNGLKMEFARIPAGEFSMGASDSDSVPHADNEKPQHKVKISRPFYMAIYPVTQEQYMKVMGLNPAEFSATGRGERQVQGMDTGRFPVENASWDDAQEFCRRLSQRTGRFCTLPTEAQWEYACRAGTSTPFYFGTWANGAQGNCNGNQPCGTKEKGPYLGRTCPVGSYPPNPWGLHDMHGNVCQWCLDYWGERYYSVSPAVDPTGPADGSTPVSRQSTGTWHKDCRVLRGGSWNDPPLGSAWRGPWMPFVRNLKFGFRVVCPE